MSDSGRGLRDIAKTETIFYPTHLLAYSQPAVIVGCFLFGRSTTVPKALIVTLSVERNEIGADCQRIIIASGLDVKSDLDGPEGTLRRAWLQGNGADWRFC
jgi:hypothetical protein